MTAEAPAVDISKVPSIDLIGELDERGDMPDRECAHCPFESDDGPQDLPVEDLKLVQQELLRGRANAALALLENIMRGLE